MINRLDVEQLLRLVAGGAQPEVGHSLIYTQEGWQFGQGVGLQGEPGPAGPAGPTTIDVGTVTTGAPGTDAEVTNSGTTEDVILDFTIPRGATGAAGADGADGADGVDSIPFATTFVGADTTKLLYRTDRNLLYFYDGAQWLSTQLYQMNMAPGEVVQFNGSAGSTVRLRAKIPSKDYSIYLEQAQVATYVVSPNDATRYWILELYRESNAGVLTSLGGSSTQSDTAGRFQDNHIAAINTVITSADLSFVMFGTRVGSTPGGLCVVCALDYRLVG